MKRKNILVFFPHNFYEMSAGCHRRIYELLCYFREREFAVDLLSINGFTNRWSKEDIRRRELFDSIRVCEWEPSKEEKLAIERSWKEGRLRNFAISPLRKAFREMVSSKEYEFVLISYVYWASLADEVSNNAIKVIDLHDFITLNLYISTGRGIFKFGRMFEEEIRAISKFNYALSISEEETIMLQPFCPETIFINVPISFSPKFKKNENHDFDLLFVGSDNPFNREGMSWFMKNVYPLLPSTIRIAVVGTVCRFLEKKENISLIPYAPDLDEIYTKTKIVFCPLRGGTGLKVKVVEALSYGIPVITTSWGLSGILQKYDNGCVIVDDAKDFAKTVLYLLNNSDEYLCLKRKAEHFFISHFSTEVCNRRLDEVFLNPKN
jgi:glycosyltransferase involved in cell wall biosynthesis